LSNACIKGQQPKIRKDEVAYSDYISSSTTRNYCMFQRGGVQSTMRTAPQKKFYLITSQR